jgi:hypothetical protein
MEEPMPTCTFCGRDLPHADYHDCWNAQFDAVMAAFDHAAPNPPDVIPYHQSRISSNLVSDE